MTANLKQFTAIDWSCVALATAVPCGLSCLAYHCLSKTDQWQWRESLKKPRWALTDWHTVNALSSSSSALVGTASFLAFKSSENFSGLDSKFALASFGTFAGLTAVALPAAFKVRDLHCHLSINAVLLVSSGIMAFSYFKLDRLAGMLCIPMIVFLSYSTAVETAMILAAKEEKGKREDVISHE